MLPFLQDIFLNAPVGIYRATLEGKLLTVNTYVAYMFGYESPESMIEDVNRSSVASLYEQSSDRQILLEKVTQANHNWTTFEQKIRTKKDIILNAHMTIRLTADGNIEGFISDITQQKLTERILRASEEKFHKVFHLSPDAISITRLSDSKIVSVNQGFQQLTGCTAEEVVGKTSLDFGMWANLDDRNRLFKDIGETGTCYNLEADFVTKDGAIKHSLMSASVIKLEGVDHLINVTRDITNRKQTEEALRQNEQKYRALFNNTPIGILLVNNKGEVLEVNNFFLQALGSPSVEGTKTINVLTYPLMVKAGLSDLFRICMSENKTMDTEIQYTSKWGKETYLRMILTPELNKQGYVEGCLSVVEDIMPRKLAEEALKRARDELELRVEERTNKLLKANEKLEMEIAVRERAERELKESNRKLELALAVASQLGLQAEAASAAKTEFLTNMSHELRTPLTAVIGFSDLLGDQLFGKLNEKQSGYVTEIAAAGRHLLRLINDILDLAKVESGKMEIRMSPVDLSELLGHCLIMIRETAMKRGLNVNLKVSEQLYGEKIQADDVRLKQIVMNLLSNAAKFTSSGGAILLQAERTGEEILVSVSDTGAGVKPDDQKRIFHAFEQLDSSFSRQEQGTGLGLALVRKLVELHGGRVWVESEGENKGSVFSFTIPFVSTAINETRPTLLSENPGGLHPLVRWMPYSEKEKPPIVMVVEDNTANLKLLTDLLQAGGYSVLQAFSAEEAIKRAEPEKPSLILMDISLPGMDGLTATKVIKGNPATAHIPVVALTAHAMKDDEARAMEAGCDTYILKPIDTRIFYSTLSGLIKSKDSGAVA
jgi:PAS domain S-box-containing protein